MDANKIEKLRSGIQYRQTMIDGNHRNSLWYGGDVLAVEYKGNTAVLTANGDVNIHYTPADGKPTVRIIDKEHRGGLLNGLSVHVKDDADIKALTERRLSDGTPVLDVLNNNWWEVFVIKDYQIVASAVMGSENYDEALSEMLKRLDCMIKDEPGTEPEPTDTSEQTDPGAMFVYHEYRDDLPYGEQIIRLFTKQETGLAYLKTRVEAVFQTSWERVAGDAAEDDTVTPEYVSIDDGARCRFFVLEPVVPDKEAN